MALDVGGAQQKCNNIIWRSGSTANTVHSFPSYKIVSLVFPSRNICTTVSNFGVILSQRNCGEVSAFSGRGDGDARSRAVERDACCGVRNIASFFSKPDGCSGDRSLSPTVLVQGKFKSVQERQISITLCSDFDVPLLGLGSKGRNVNGAEFMASTSGSLDTGSRDIEFMNDRIDSGDQCFYLGIGEFKQVQTALRGILNSNSGFAEDTCENRSEWSSANSVAGQPVQLEPENKLQSANSPQERWLKRCIHHLLAVMVNLKVMKHTSRWEESMYSYCSKQLELEEIHRMISLRNLRTSSFYRCASRPRSMHIWTGYWVGPEDEDGWGNVEAFVQTVGQPVGLSSC